MTTIKQSVLVFCASDSARDSMHSILDNEYEIVESKNLEQTLKIINEMQTSVCIIDYASATLDDEDIVGQIANADSNTLILLTCPSEKRDELLTTPLPKQTFRVLFSPVSPGQTRLAVAAAFKHLENKSQQSSDSISADNIDDKKQKTKLMPIIAAISIIGVSLLSWFLVTNKNTKDTQSQQKVVAQAEVNLADDVKRLLLTAKAATRAKNLFPPEGINALDSYIKVLELDKNNAQANEGLKALSQAALGDFDLHFSNGSTDEAIASIGSARDISANHENFAALVEVNLEQKRISNLDNIKTALNADRVSDAANTLNTYIEVFSDDSDEIFELETQIKEKELSLNRNTEINTLLSNSKNALNNNRLLTPDQNNARYFINRLENTDSAHPELITLKDQLATMLLDESRKSVLDIDFSSAKRYLEAATALGANSDLIENLQINLTNAEDDFIAEQAAIQAAAQVVIEEDTEAKRIAEEQQLAEQNAQLEAERIADEERKAEEEKQAQINLLATPVTVTLSELKATNRTAPVYPKRLESRGTTGSATIAFTVNKNGATSNITVESVEPVSAVAFGTSAQKAVESWSFEPYQDADGNVRIANSKISIVFQ